MSMINVTKYDIYEKFLSRKLISATDILLYLKDSIDIKTVAALYCHYLRNILLFRIAHFL